MKRVGGLWESVISFENLHEAARRAALGKRKRPDVAAFLWNVETELVSLRRELGCGEYAPGPYREFLVRDGKPRLISAAPFRDRVVHHALTQVLEPIFERRFSNHSYACRTGKGTHRALEQAKRGAARFPYVLKCDVRKYFASIDHEILKGLLARVLKCHRTLDLAARIIDGFPPRTGGPDVQEEVPLYFPGDDLFTPFRRRRGLPLGNQTSQFFANVYLNPLDRFIEGTLGPGCYVRYVDDFLLFGASKAELSVLKRKIEDFLGPLRLSIHDGKSRVYRSGDGFTFLGFRLFPGRTRVIRCNVVRFRRRLRRLQREFDAGAANRSEVHSRIQSWIGHAKAADTRRLRIQLFSTLKLVERSAV